MCKGGLSITRSDDESVRFGTDWTCQSKQCSTWRFHLGSSFKTPLKMIQLDSKNSWPIHDDSWWFTNINHQMLGLPKWAPMGSSYRITQPSARFATRLAELCPPQHWIWAPATTRPWAICPRSAWAALTKGTGGTVGELLFLNRTAGRAIRKGSSLKKSRVYTCLYYTKKSTYYIHSLRNRWWHDHTMWCPVR